MAMASASRHRRRVVRRQHDPRALGVGRDSGLVAHRAEHVRGFFPSSRLAKHHQDGGVRVHVTRFARVAHVAPHLVCGGPILAPTQRRDGGGGNLVRAHLVRLESRRVAPTFHDDARVATIGRRAEQTHQRVSIRAVLLGARAAPRVHPKIQRVRAIESAAFAQFLDGEVERGGGKFGDVRHRRVDGTTRGSNAIGRRRVARVAIVGAGITRPGVAALGREANPPSDATPSSTSSTPRTSPSATPATTSDRSASIASTIRSPGRMPFPPPPPRFRRCCGCCEGRRVC